MKMAAGAAWMRLLATCAAISCVSLGLAGAAAASSPCGRCRCELFATTADLPAQRTLLYVDCARTASEGAVPVPDLGGFTYTDLEADFQHNRISIVQYQLLRGVNVQTLNLANNVISSIPDKTFSKLTTLIELNLSNNKLINNLNTNTFKGLDNLERLYLSGNEIKALESTVFHFLPSLKSLKLDKNFLRDIPSDLFISVKNLQDLHLNENAISAIDKVTFHPLSNLEVLDLSGNVLTDLNERTFQKSTKLATLKMSANNLTGLPANVFKTLTSMTYLDVSENRIAVVGKELFLPVSLRHLDIGHNRIRETVMLFQSFDDLQELHMEDNNFDQVDVLQTFTKLQVLNISSNIVKSFPLQTYPHLRVLDLSDNLFPNIPAFISGQHLPSLQRLILDGNPFPEIKFPPTTTMFKNLTFVSLSRLPAVREIPAGAFGTLASTYSDCSANGAQRVRRHMLEVLSGTLPQNATIPWDQSAQPGDVTADESQDPGDNARAESGVLPVIVDPKIVPSMQEKPSCRGGRKSVGCRSGKELTSQEMASREVGGVAVPEGGDLAARIADAGDSEGGESTGGRSDAGDLQGGDSTGRGSDGGDLAARIAVAGDSEGGESTGGRSDAGDLQGGDSTGRGSDGDDLAARRTDAGDVEGGDFIARSGAGDLQGGESTASRADKGDLQGGGLAARTTDEGDLQGGDFIARSGAGDLQGGESTARTTDEGDLQGGGLAARTTDEGDLQGGDFIARSGAGDLQGGESTARTTDEGDLQGGGLAARRADEGDFRRGELAARRVPMEADEGGDKGVQRMSSLRKEPTTGWGLTLRLRANRNLMTVHEDAFKEINACEVDLSSNSLTTIPERSLDWSAVRSVDLQGNPWDCSCNLQWMLDVIVPKLYTERPDLLYELRCARPSALSGRRFVHFHNWTVPVFCKDYQQLDQLRRVEAGEPVVVKGSVGISNAMLITLCCCVGLVVVLVAVGLAYQWRVADRRRRKRNRRM